MRFSTPVAVTRCIIAILCFVSFNFPTLAQEKNLKFSRITVESGLPSNTVNSAVQDLRGFMWIATENGVSRYDGYTFTKYRANEDDSLSLSSNKVYTVYADQQDRIWVGSEKGLDLYNRNTDKFERHFFKGISIRAIFQDKNKRLWAGGDEGVYLYDEKKREFINYFQNQLKESSEFYNTVYSIIDDEEGRLWIGYSHEGIIVYDFASKQVIRYKHEAANSNSLSNNSVRRIIKDPYNQLWIATYGGGINCFKKKTGKFVRYGENNGLSSDLTYSIWSDKNGVVWIGTDGNGIDILNPKTGTFQHYVHSPYNSGSLNNNVIRYIAGDNRGGVWIGTYAGGINFYNENCASFIHYKIPTFNGITSVTAFAEDSKGNLWIGTDGGGLSYFNRSAGTFQNITYDKTNKAGLPDNRILALMIDDEENLWIGTYLGGISKYDTKTKAFHNYNTKTNCGLSNDIIWAIIQDSNKRIWAGTNEGLNLYNDDNDSFTSYKLSNSNISSNLVRSLYEDSKRRVWVATQEGLNLYNEESNDFTIIKSDPKNKFALSSNWIRNIKEDNEGNLLLGTFEGGINIYHEPSNSFSSYKEKDGLPDNMISSVLADEENNLWIGTGKGLARMENNHKKVVNYFASDGLQDNEFSINACLKTRNGEFLFGGINGFNIFLPKAVRQVKQNLYPPQLALTGFKIFNKDIPINKEGSELEKQINETKEIILEYNQSVLTFEFAALNFLQSERNQYAYKLNGFEKNWNYIGNKRSATYTNLNSGNYTFQVKASNNEGIWTKDSLNVRIIITPPFWETWWFKVLVAFVLLAIAFVVYLIIRNRIREKISINKLIAELEIKALIAQMNPHFIFNCLNSIQELIIMNKQDQAMHYLNRFSKILRTVLQSSEKNIIPLDWELTLLELYLELEAMRFDKHFDYDIQIDPKINLEGTLIPSFLIQPFVEKALWELSNKQEDRNLIISFKLDSEQLLVCRILHDGITSNEPGIGNSVEFFTDKVQSLGIKTIQERIKLMKKQDNNAALLIEDEKDEEGNVIGTSVIIKIPIGTKTNSSKSSFFRLEKKREKVKAEII